MRVLVIYNSKERATVISVMDGKQIHNRVRLKDITVGPVKVMPYANGNSVEVALLPMAPLDNAPE